MFSRSLGRAAHRATSSAATTSNTTSTATQCLAARRSTAHQRRPSSSKASCPPDSNKPTPAAKAAATDDASQAPASERTAKSPSRQTRPYKRAQGSRSDRPLKSKQPVIDQFAGLPAVPAIQHLDEREKDLKFSSFFALHRPLSLTTTIPPTCSQEQFESIFESKILRDPWENGNSAERRPEDVIFTLHNAIETLENSTASPADSEGLRWEIIQESPSNSEGVKHLDGAPRMKSLDELVAQFKPYRVPPPPQPFPTESRSADKRRPRKPAKEMQFHPQQESYTTTIVVTASTSPDGQRTFTASSSPIVRIPDPQQADESAERPAIQESSPRIRQPFLERMRRRQGLYLHNQHSKILERVGERSTGYVRKAPSGRRMKMLLISVKRQRKLKMKKHKYKKLMKRTRNLRRRLERS